MELGARGAWGRLLGGTPSIARPQLLLEILKLARDGKFSHVVSRSHCPLPGERRGGGVGRGV